MQQVLARTPKNLYDPFKTVPKMANARIHRTDRSFRSPRIINIVPTTLKGTKTASTAQQKWKSPVDADGDLYFDQQSTVKVLQTQALPRKIKHKAGKYPVRQHDQEEEYNVDGSKCCEAGVVVAVYACYPVPPCPE